MGICAFAVEGMMFSPKRPKRGRVNSVFMRFSITFFPGKGVRLSAQGGNRSSPRSSGVGE